jgi:hypothetical protein
MLFKSGPPRYGAWGANGRFGSQGVLPPSASYVASSPDSQHLVVDRVVRLGAQLRKSAP